MENKVSDLSKKNKALMEKDVKLDSKMVRIVNCIGISKVEKNWLFSLQSQLQGKNLELTNKFSDLITKNSEFAKKNGVIQSKLVKLCQIMLTFHPSNNRILTLDSNGG